MEWLNILLSSLLGLLSPVGLILDRTLEGAIRDRFEEIEELQVRIDNSPSHQILAGKVERVRVAGRGLWLPVSGLGEVRALRIAVLEVETDPIDVDLDRLDDGIEALEKPFRGGIRLVLTQADLDRALSLSATASQVPSFEMGDYRIIAPQIHFTDENRLQARVTLYQNGDDEPLQVTVESGFRVQRGRYLEFVEPRVSLNGEEASPQLFESILGQSGQLDLDRLTPPGTLIRLLRWHLTPDRFEMAAFISIDG